MIAPPVPVVTVVPVVDCGVGSTAAIVGAFRRLEADVDLTADLDRVASARLLVLSGVTAFAPAMSRLLETGLESAVRAAIKRGARLLGCCAGFQLLFEECEDARGVHKGLGLVSGRIRPFSENVRATHVGWNQLAVRRPADLMKGVSTGSWMFFVHSSRAEGAFENEVAATVIHGEEFPAVVQREGVWGCQFRPEKSSECGRLLLSNFLSMEGLKAS